MDEFLNNNPQNDTNETVSESVSPPVTEPQPQPVCEPVTETVTQESVIQNNPLNDIEEMFAKNAVNSSQNIPPDPDFTQPTMQAPIYNPVSYTPVNPVTDYKPMSRGLKVFALILAMVIAFTGMGLAGYYLGQNNNTVSKVDLAAKPKNTDEKTAAQVYEDVNKSIVGITVYNTSGAGGQASGIVYSNNGYIVTNDHIYSDIPNAKFKIHTFDGKEYDAEYVAGDLISDLAVLKIKKAELTPAVFGNSDELYMGQNVVAIGRPNDATESSSITKGIVSAIDRRVKNASNYSARLIQTDTPINPGSSGGALVNMYGQIVGVTASKLASVEYEGVGYAIPTTVMKKIVEELIKEGKVVSRAKLGITYSAMNSVLSEMNNYKYTGLLVESVADDSDLSGKINKGDMIIKINGQDITDDDIVLDIIEKCSAGDTITVTVYTKKDNEKEGKTKEYKAVLKANIGESSYSTKDSSKDSSESDKESNGGAFDFPIGEE